MSQTATELTAVTSASTPVFRTGGMAVAIPIVAILGGHYLVDVYSAIFPSLLGVMETEFRLTPYLGALLLGTGSICSGLAQPLFAWLSDRWNTRIFGALGMVLGALGICTVGFLSSTWALFLMYAVGMAGVGMFHPIAASTIGRLAGDRKGIAISWFFVFGMAGCFSGALVGPWLAAGTEGSLGLLTRLILPGLLFALGLQWCIGRIEHRAPASQSGHLQFVGYDWGAIGLLYVASAMRFLVNLSLVYLLVRWVESHVAIQHPGWTAGEVSGFASPLVGRFNAALVLGMACGGLAAGSLIPAGREKRPLILLPILFAPAIMAVGQLAPDWTGMGACFLAGMGFASLVPVTVSLAQRLMPGHTSLASGLMLGGAWAIACLGPMMTQVVLSQIGLGATFVCVGALLALSGLISLGLNERTIRIENR